MEFDPLYNDCKLADSVFDTVKLFTSGVSKFEEEFWNVKVLIRCCTVSCTDGSGELSNSLFEGIGAVEEEAAENAEDDLLE